MTGGLGLGLQVVVQGARPVGLGAGGGAGSWPRDLRAHGKCGIRAQLQAQRSRIDSFHQTSKRFVNLFHFEENRLRGRRADGSSAPASLQC